ncbi:flagellar export chaperone FliS [Psychrosphaera sp. F3M07]|mgnify:FL=1|jgi:flagellar protein FliS|uniref:Flagellar export chaperone FliS n=1 Tax=Psychrosphaera aquimarina TaxID=2044854 RepID=A0ABU3R0I5_9GAMM|nr:MULTISPECIES: flagellar export chaperone FliS [Psychrosphaera]MBU2917463.1 flagellar export chaperone FliS [Psychrosphaera sp. F3M07]MDU0112808.1 flagellar export chaperone FliS [Psychrosphaera aquimarina]
MRSAIKMYTHMNAQTQLTDASPHKVIQLLMAGAIDRLIKVSAMMENQTGGYHDTLSNAIDIILALNCALDMEKGGEISQNLNALYDYMQLQLVQANIEKDYKKVDEVVDLIKTIKDGWDQISDQ